MLTVLKCSSLYFRCALNAQTGSKVSQDGDAHCTGGLEIKRPKYTPPTQYIELPVNVSLLTLITRSFYFQSEPKHTQRTEKLTLWNGTYFGQRSTVAIDTVRFSPFVFRCKTSALSAFTATDHPPLTRYLSHGLSPFDFRVWWHL